MDTALLIVDFQNDFTIGALPNPRSEEIAQLTNVYMRGRFGEHLLVGSRDAHEEGDGTHQHFQDYGLHCVKGTPGYQYYSRFQSNYLSHHVEKGKDGAAASAFEGKDPTGASLNRILDGYGITKLEVCGFVAEVCVLETIRDAIQTFGYETSWLPGLTASLTSVGIDAVAKQVLAMGGHIK